MRDISRIVTSKGEYVCYGCTDEIKEGEPMAYLQGFGNDRLCYNCTKIEISEILKYTKIKYENAKFMKDKFKKICKDNKVVIVKELSE